MNTNADTISPLCTTIFTRKWVCPTTISIPTAAVQMYNFTGIETVPPKLWDALLCDTTCFLQKNYLMAIEEAVGGKENFRYCVVTQNEKTVLIAACQIIKFDIKQTYNYTQEVEQAKTLWEKIKNGAANQFKQFAGNIDVQLLVCGNTFLSGEYAFMYHSDFSEQEAIKLLTDALENLRKEEAQKGKNIRAILVKDFLLDAEHPATLFNEKGYHTFKAEPIMHLAIPSEWKTFEDYANVLSSKYRQRLKSAYKKSQVLTRKEMTLAEMEKWNDKMYFFFESVVKNAGFNLKETPKDYFLSLKKYLGDAFPVYAYFNGEELVAFMSMIRTPNHYEGHFLGFDEAANHEYKMYMRMLYDMIDISIQGKTSLLNMGRTALEIKTTVGAVPQEANLYLKICNPIFNRLATPIMQSIKTEAFVQRHPFKGAKEETEA